MFGIFFRSSAPFIQFSDLLCHDDSDGTVLIRGCKQVNHSLLALAVCASDPFLSN